MMIQLLPLLFSVGIAQLPGGVPETIREEHGRSLNPQYYAFAAGGDLDGDGFGDFALAHLSPVRISAYSGLTSSPIWTVPLPGSNPWVTERGLEIIEDVNGDGRADVAVCDLGNSLVRMHSGADGALLWSMSDPAFPSLGWCVDGGGDSNADGFSDLIIYDYWALHPNGFHRGAGVILSGLDGSILRVHYLRLNFDIINSGRVMAFAGDLDGDGSDDVLVGAVLSSQVVETQLYSGATGALIRICWEPAYGYGSSVANAGDMDLDGVPDQAVSASLSDEIFVYSGASGARLWQLKGPSGVAWSRFGNALDGGRDLDGDGVTDLLVGAPAFRASMSDSPGAIFAVSGSDGLVLEQFRGPYLLLTGEAVDFFKDDPVPGTPPCFLFGGFQEYGLLSRPVVVATIATWHAGLRINATEISAAQGARLDLAVEFPASEAGLQYVILVSRTGAGPTVWRGLAVPLTFDQWTTSVAFDPPANFHGSRGVLDAAGDARAYLRVPAGASNAWIGSSVWFAAVTGSEGVPVSASIAREIRFLP